MKRKLNISTNLSTSLKVVYESLIISQTSQGIYDTTINKLPYPAIGVDVEDLTDSFTITFRIPNSSGKTEKFTFTI